MHKLLQLIANRIQSASPRQEMLDGALHLVVPGVAVKLPMVLNGELLLAEEIDANTWNGIPITLDHVFDDRGNPITVNSKAGERQVMGIFRNARVEDGALRGEYWLNFAKAVELGNQASKIITNAKAGRVIEQSTGYFRQLEETPGEFGGKAYRGIQRDIKPDHIAVLPAGMKGVCSIADGCGAMRVHAVMNDAEKTGIMIAFYLPPSLAAELALSAEDLPASSEALTHDQLHITLAYIGKVGEVDITEGQALDFLRYFAESNTTIRAEVHGVGRFNTESDGKTPLYAQVDSPLLREFHDKLITWLTDMGIRISQNYGYTPHVTLAYVPAEEPVDLLPKEKMDVILDRVALSWGNHTTVFPLQGYAMPVMNSCNCQESRSHSMENNESNNGGGQEGEQPNKEQLAINAQVTTLGTQFAQLTEQIAKVLGFFSDIGGMEQARETMQLARSHAQAMTINAQREKGNLVTALVANSRCAFGRDELEKMEISTLGKLAESLAPQDFSLRGGLSVHRMPEGATIEEMPMPELFPAKKYDHQ